MRRVIIPAQITTVEDKIAGNFNLTQIILLVTPVFIATILFSLIPPIMKLTAGKISLAIIFLLMSLILVLRIKEKIILDWFLIWIRFRLRPNFYVFDKNDNFLRETEVETKKENKAKTVKFKKIKNNKEIKLTEHDEVKLLHVINKRNNSLSFEFSQKGGLDVAMETVKK